MREEAVLDLDGRHVLPAGDDHVLLAVLEGQVIFFVDDTAVAGMEPVVDERIRGRFWIVPVRLEDHVAASQHLAVVGERQGDPERGIALPGELRSPLRRCEPIPFRPVAVDGEKRCRLGQAVDLDELPTQFGFNPFDGLGGGRRARDHDADLAPTRDLAVPFGRGLEDGGHHRRRAAHDRDPVLLNPAQYLRAVDLAQHHMRDSHGGHDIGHAPAVAVEHR